MRLIVMFDLPAKTKKEIQHYQKFHNLLLQQGFYMIQYSVYGKLCLNQEQVLKTTNCLTNQNYLSGDIRCLAITEKQYQGMQFIKGSKSYQEQLITTDFLVEL